MTSPMLKCCYDLVCVFPMCFRLLGLCNNFAYVIMLSAAHDILKEDESPHQHNVRSPAT